MRRVAPVHGFHNVLTLFWEEGFHRSLSVGQSSCLAHVQAVDVELDFTRRGHSMIRRHYRRRELHLVACFRLSG